MGKLFSIAFATVGSAILVVYVFNPFGEDPSHDHNVDKIRSGSENRLPHNYRGDRANFRLRPISSQLSFETLSDFKKSNGGSCVNSYFPNIDLSRESNAWGGDRFDSSYDDPKSCLIVNWNRTLHSSNQFDSVGRWSGNFRLLWAFRNGASGFVLFATTKPFSSEGSIDWEGGIYSTSRYDNTWRVSKYEEIGDGKNITKDNFSSSFPAVEDEIVDLSWGFMNRNVKSFGLDHIYINTNLGTSLISAKEPDDFKESFMWTFKSRASDQKLTKWVSNFEVWLGYLFGERAFELVKSLNSFSGSWVKN